MGQPLGKEGRLMKQAAGRSSRTGSRTVWRVSAGLILAIAIVAVPTGAWGEIIYAVDAYGVEPVDTRVRSSHITGPATDSFTANGITFNIWYQDVIDGSGFGFDDASNGAARRARLADTLTYAADVLNETGTLDIYVRPSLNSGASFLARAGTYFSGTPGFQTGSAFTRIDSASKPFINTEEIYVEVDFHASFNWYSGTGNPGGSQYDLQSVLLHEVTHGLGILTLSEADGTGALQNADNTYATFDSFTETSGGTRLWSGSPPSLQVAQSQLTSENLFWNGTNGVTAYNQSGTRPGIYAPNPFESGSSLSHWDTGNILGPDAVMEHAIAFGVANREYAPLEIGALKDIGWSNAAAGVDPLDPDNVYVDFSFGGAESGAQNNPFNTLGEAVSAANASANIFLEPGSSSETFSGGSAINKALTLQNNNQAGGPVTIGAAGARSVTGGQSRTGFVSGN